MVQILSHAFLRLFLCLFFQEQCTYNQNLLSFICIFICVWLFLDDYMYCLPGIHSLGHNEDNLIGNMGKESIFKGSTFIDFFWNIPDRIVRPEYNSSMYIHLRFSERDGHLTFSSFV